NRTTAQRSYSFYHENSRAAFAQATYDLSALVPGLRVTGGYRYTVDKISGCGFNRNVNLPVANESDCRAAGGFRGNVRSAEPTWTYGLDYDIAQDVLGYVTVRRGYRGGGFNAPRLSTTAPRSLAAFQTFDPEILNDTEVGLKSTWNWNGMRGRFNIAYWHDKYSGVQLNQSVGVNFDLDNDASNDPQGGSVVINAGKAKLDGVDIDLSITPVEGLTLGATAAYMNARFTSVTRPAIFTAATAAPAYQNAPKWTYSFDVAYALPFIDPSLGEVVVGGNYYHRATFVLQNLTLPATGMGNLRVDWKGVYGSDFDLGLRVDNVGNTRDIVAAGISTSSLGQFSASYNDPRMVSVSLKYHF
ncbi:MAG: hypothetical protein JWO33_2106, partial [Caulobacteraceae bacterium]|nr:hypothetical protein [Caulobacteraceae bacterium]